VVVACRFKFPTWTPVAEHSGPLGGGLEFSQLVELECLTAC